MNIQVMKSKIHRAKLTGCELNYEGSITVDQDMMDKVGLVPYEKVLIVNNNNGERLETYVIPGVRGQGDYCLNGAAARKACPDDRVIIIAFGSMTVEEAKEFEPQVVLLDENNDIVEFKTQIEPNSEVFN